MMIPKFMSRFKGEEEAQEEKQKQKQQLKMKKLNNQKRKKSSSEEEDGSVGRRRSQTSATMDVIGLRLLTQITNSHTKSNNVVVKSALLRIANNTNTASSSSSSSNSNSKSPLELCFLKTCNLCNKKLSYDKDIYMYRGDQGFCSIECRNRQIVMDEMKELEGSTNYKQRVSSSSSSSCSYRNCWTDARRETRLILEDLRLHRLQSKPIPNSPHHQNHWAIVS